MPLMQSDRSFSEVRTEFKVLLETLLEECLVRDDSIFLCGTAPLAIIQARPEDVLQLAHERLYAFPFKDVPECWRRLYTEATLWKCTKIDSRDWVADVVRLLDMAIIMTGAPGRLDAIHSLFRILYQDILYVSPESGERGASVERPIKRRRMASEIPDHFPSGAQHAFRLEHALPRVRIASLSAFERQLKIDHEGNDERGPTPIIITGYIDHWPAMSDEGSLWSNPRNLYKRFLNGHRIVPVEIGRSYTDQGWSQRIMTFGKFFSEYMLQVPTDAVQGRKVGYLAQHDLFTQLPELRADIMIPDFCYSDVPNPKGSNESIEEDHVEEQDVLLNAWFGPAHTISPLHTDSHHNILAQVAGSKYVRLYAPSESANLYPRASEDGVDMSNTSQVDLDLAMRCLEHRNLDPFEVEDTDEDELRRSREAFLEEFPNFENAKFLEGVLGPGDCLFIPRGWFHYVRSLSASCSVSFWW